jgi:uncharacterized protein
VKVLIAGLTARAIAESAVRAGCDVVTVDYFGDLDTKRLCPNVSLRERGLGYAAPALARLARELQYDAVAYCGGLENHPDVVAELAAGKVLLGNGPETLRRVRDPAILISFLDARGYAVPATTFHTSGRGYLPTFHKPGHGHLPMGGPWLVKPAAGGGGQGVHFWRGQPLPPRHILQEYVQGVPASAVFVASGRRSVVLGWSEQLHAPTAFRYGGNVLPLEAPSVTLAELRHLTQALTEEFGLIGLNGVDFVLRGTRPVIVEVNPRYSASMELVESATGIPLFGLHLASCEGRLPDPETAAAALGLTAETCFRGKAIVYARESVSVADPLGWIERGVRDVPHLGEVIARGHPICTVLASGPSREVCLANLRAKEATILEACAPRSA